MNNFKRAIIIMIVFIIPGCAATYKYQGNNFPALSSLSFPVFTYVNEIPEDITKKVSEGKGKTKMTMKMTYANNQKNVVINSDSDVDWNINFDGDLVYSSYVSQSTLTSQKETKKINFKLDCIHEKNGKELKFEVVKGSKNDLSNDEIKALEKPMSDYVKSIFSNIGKSIKVGDVYSNSPSEFGQKLNVITNGKYQDGFPEIVKGMGVYQNKKVIVTEFLVDESIQTSDITIEFRMKGYKLYDPESFIQLVGKGTGYVMLFTPKEGTVSIKMEVDAESYDVQLKNTVDSICMTSPGTSGSSKSPGNNGKDLTKGTPEKNTDAINKSTNLIKQIPSNIKKEIKQKCASDFPSDYAQQAKCVKLQEAGWIKMNQYDEIQEKSNPDKSTASASLESQPSLPNNKITQKSSVPQNTLNHTLSQPNPAPMALGNKDKLSTNSSQLSQPGLNQYKVAIFPFEIFGEAAIYSGLLVDRISSKIMQSYGLRLSNSYYKLKNINAITDVSIKDIYSDTSAPDLTFITKKGTELGVDLAILAKMNFNCVDKTSGKCDIRRMELIIVNLITGKIYTSAPLANLAVPEDVMDEACTDVFNKFETDKHNR